MRKIHLILLLITVFSAPLISAEKDSQVPDISIGINGNYGYFDVIKKNMDFENKKGIYAGGGVTVEKLLNANTGFGSGIQYRRFKTNFIYEDSASAVNPALKVTWSFQSVNIPFVILLSFRGGFFGVSLEAGAVYSHISYSTMELDTTLPVIKTTENAVKYMKSDQMGLTAGTKFRLEVTDHTDFTLGVTGEYYPTNLLIQREGFSGKLNMYNYSLTIGYMLRTNVFSR